MSRKLILSLTAITTLASTALVSGPADAMVSRGGRGGTRRSFAPITRISMSMSTSGAFTSAAMFAPSATFSRSSALVPAPA